MDSKAIAVVRNFIAAINQGDASQLSRLMTRDHTFVDSGGRAESGCDNMTKGWDEYCRSTLYFKARKPDSLKR